MVRFFQQIVTLFLNARPYDLLINLGGVRSLQQSGILYSWALNPSPQPLFYTFVSSPFVAVLLWPFAGLSDLNAVIFFRLFSVILYLAAVLLIGRANRFKLRSSSIAFGLFWFVALCWSPLFDSIGLGQINEIVLICLALAYWGWLRNDHVLAGIGIGLAAAIKISPILFIVPWLLRRQWRPVSIALLVAGLCAGVSCVVVTPGQCVAFAASITPAISGGTSDYYNISFNGFWARLLATPDVAQWTNLSMLPGIWVMRLLSFLCDALLIASIFATLRRNAIPKDRQRAIEFGLMLLIILLVSPLTWWHYQVWLIIVVGIFLVIANKIYFSFITGVTVAALILINLLPNMLLSNALVISKTSLVLADVWQSSATIGLLILIGILIVAQRYESVNH